MRQTPGTGIACWAIVDDRLREAEPGCGRGGEGGFTILEALVAATVLATALVALAQVIAIATTATARARATTRAALVAGQKLEELRADAAAIAPVDASDAVAHGLVRRWTITALPGGAALALTVEVTHLGAIIPPIRVETIRARPRAADEP